MRNVGLFILLLLPAWLWAPCQAQVKDAAPTFSDEAVEKAIQAGRKFLWSKYDANQGHWPEFAGYPGGLSSLIAYALLSAGENPQQKDMHRALDWLSKLEMEKTYCLSLRCQVWSLVSERSEGVSSRPAMQSASQLLTRDAEKIIKSICQPLTSDSRYDLQFGSYGYDCTGQPGKGGDHSNTQYAILGAWAAALNGVNVPSRYWELVYNHFKMTQCDDGSWAYTSSPEGSGTGSMTTAGLASLFIAYDFFCRDRFSDVGYDPTPLPIRAGLAWFGQNLSVDETTSLYYLYGIERVGMASGYKFFGRKDWYKMGAEALLATQRPDGSWNSRGPDGDDLSATSFALLFLIRGRNPVLFNRLQYSGDWNNRPRALANLTRWMSRAFERDVSWQIVNLATDVEQWHDAPILVISGSEEPEFTPQDIEKLRTFVYQGGMIFTVSEGKDGDFDRAVRGKDGLYAQLFPDNPLEEFSADNEVFACHAAIKSDRPLYGVSNGIRLLAVHCPGDLPLSWQSDARKTAIDDFNLAANLVIYATDRTLRHRGTSNWPENKPWEPRKSSAIARIEYNGNYNPEPLALRRFAMLMGQMYRLKLEVEGHKLADLNAAQTPLAFLTGTGELRLSEQEKAALKSYVEAGGTVVVDAAGGSEKFADSATSILADIFGQQNIRLLPPQSPVLRRPGFEIDSARYRRAAKVRLSNAKGVRLWSIQVGDRPAVYLAREDLTAGLTGYSSFTCAGYDPSTAFEIVRNIAFAALNYTPPTPKK